MADQEIEAVRTFLMARPRPDGISERRKRLDDLGTRYKIASDVHIESVDANGVKARMVIDPTCRLCLRDPIFAWWWLSVWFTR